MEIILLLPFLLFSFAYYFIVPDKILIIILNKINKVDTLVFFLIFLYYCL